MKITATWMTSASLTLACGLMATASSQADVLPLDEDYIVRGDNTSGDTNADGFRVGESSSGLRNALFAFVMPDLGAVADPFLTASLTSEIESIDLSVSGGPTLTELNFNADVYVYTGSDALPVDAFAGANDTSTDYTKVIDDYYVPSVTLGTPITASGTLASLLNTLYDGGSGIGSTFFLRISPDEDTATIGGSTSYDVLGQENAGFSGNTFIEFAAVPEPTSLALIGLGGVTMLRRRRRV